MVQLYLLSSRICQPIESNRKSPSWCNSGLTPFHVLPINICIETLQQVLLAFDVALDRREWFHHLRDMFTLFRLGLRHDLSAIEGSESLHCLLRTQLAFPPVIEQIEELLNVHLIVNVNKIVIVGLDTGNKSLRIYEASMAALELTKHALCVVE